MNMDQLFKALPRDLLWEVLSEFVGSHSVRNGKLIKKLVFGSRHKMLQDLPRIQRCYIGQYKTDFNAVTWVDMRDNNGQIMFCIHPIYGEMGYTVRHKIVREGLWIPAYRCQYTPMNYSVVLPPFEKHSYPSYPFTDKKKKNHLLMQK